MISFVLIGAASGALAVFGLVLLRDQRRPVAINYRGRRLRVVLGMAVSFSLILVVAFASLLSGHWAAFDREPSRLWLWVGLLLVFWAGVYDDLHPGRGRGLRGHLRELTHGRITPGVVKLVAIVSAALAVALALHAATLRISLGVPVMAGAANVWNLLDVQPGRSVKFFLVAAMALAPFEARRDPILIPAALGAAVIVLPIDLTERAMLGDAGANTLGFVIGVAAFETLPTWGLAVTLVGILALHFLAEILTLSEVIRANRVLRRFDDLGRAHRESGAKDSVNR